MRVVKKPEERKAEMVEAAAKLFVAQGFVRTSVAEIVAAVDVAAEAVVAVAGDSSHLWFWIQQCSGAASGRKSTNDGWEMPIFFFLVAPF